MGERGPVPKRTEERRRRNKSNTESVDVFGDVEIPPPAEGWHPLATDWYLSLAQSGQSRYFEPSDWMAAQVLAHEITRMLSGKVNGVMFGAIWSAMADLLTTEGARRRLGVEIARKPDAPATPLASVTPIDRYSSL